MAIYGVSGVHYNGAPKTENIDYVCLHKITDENVQPGRMVSVVEVVILLGHSLVYTLFWDALQQIWIKGVFIEQVNINGKVCLKGRHVDIHKSDLTELPDMSKNLCNESARLITADNN